MSDTPRTDAALEGETDAERIRALYKTSCELERENAKLRESLKWSMRDLREPTLIRGQNDSYVAGWTKAHNLIQP